MSDPSWDELRPENSILFIGSGFSKGATNKENHAFLDGAELSALLCKTLGYSSTEDLPLREVSDDFIPENASLLNETLQPILTTKSITADHSEVISKRWRRVYTTNFDDVFEFGLLSCGMQPDPVSFCEPVRKGKDQTQVVHLHGYIHRCSNENIDDELVLTERSYVRQLAKPRPWFDQFTDDIRFCQSLIFLGYSLRDTPINALLLSDSGIREKTHFITDTKTSERDKKLSQYGKVRPITLSGFANHLRSAQGTRQERAPKRFLAFEELNPKKDNKIFTAATSIEVRNLLTYGKFNRLSCAASWPNADYVIPRNEKISDAIGAFAFSKTVLVHSRAGNGKSLFFEMLSIALARKGYRCIRSKSRPILMEDDLSLLRSTQRLVVFFGSLDDAAMFKQQIENPRTDMHFVVEVPTSIADVRANAIGRELLHPLHRVDLNYLTNQDKLDFEKILKISGIRPANFNQAFAGCNELRDFLLRLYKNEKICRAILDHAKPLWNNSSVRRVMVATFSLRALELDVSPVFKREIVGEDPAATLEGVLQELGNSVHDLFEFRDATVEPFSSIVSQFILSQLMGPRDVLEWALRVATRAARLKQALLDQDAFNSRFKEAAKVLGKVLQVTSLRELLGKTADRDERILSMFEEARQVPEINIEPLFWLQFAILHTSTSAPLEQLQLALEYIQTAYQRSAIIPHFKDFQLDTYHAHLLLLIETHTQKLGTPIEHWQALIPLLMKIGEMLREPAHRDFSLRVLEHIEPFVLARLPFMIPTQKHELRNLCLQLASSLEKQTKISPSSNETLRLSLLRSAERLGSVAT